MKLTISDLYLGQILASQLAIRIELDHKLETAEIFVVRDRCIRSGYSVMATIVIIIAPYSDMLSDGQAQD